MNTKIIDKIKGLESRNDALLRRNSQLAQENEEAKTAVRQISLVTDAVMIAVAETYGDRREDGSFSLTIPEVDVADNLSRFRVSACRDGDKRVIVVSPHGKEPDHGTLRQ